MLDFGVRGMLSPEVAKENKSVTGSQHQHWVDLRDGKLAKDITSCGVIQPQGMSLRSSSSAVMQSLKLSAWYILIEFKSVM